MQKRAEGELIADRLARPGCLAKRTGVSFDVGKRARAANCEGFALQCHSARASRVWRRARTRRPHSMVFVSERTIKDHHHRKKAWTSPQALRAVREQGVEILQDAACSSGDLRLRHEQSRLPCTLRLGSLA